MRLDIALPRDDAGRFLPWIIAFMVYLAAMLLVISFTLGNTIEASRNAQIESFSVHIPYNEKEKDLGEKVLSIVKSQDGVLQANILGNIKIKEMVEPWFGKSDSVLNLPLPIIIEAKIKSGSNIDYTKLLAKIQSVAAAATLDDHKKWLKQFSDLVNIIQTSLFVITLMIVFATTCIVIFACKTSLKIHRMTVNLLHRLGALDCYIAKQFQNYAALITLKGSFVGSGFAAGSLIALSITAKSINSPLFPAFNFSISHCLILFALPIIMSLIALLVVRFSVLSSLKRYL